MMRKSEILSKGTGKDFFGGSSKGHSPLYINCEVISQFYFLQHGRWQSATCRLYWYMYW